MKTTTQIAQRMQHIAPFYVMDILARAKALETQGKKVIHLEVGEPDFPTPEAVKQAAKQALDNDLTFYTPATGLYELKQTILEYYRQHITPLYRNTAYAQLSAQNIVITPGASGALQLALGVLLNPGEELMLADPGYPCNRHFAQVYGAEALSVPVNSDTHYQLTAPLIKQHWSDKTRAVLLASPSNPTGTLITAEQMCAIIEQVEQLGGLVLVDEIYQGLVYATHEYSAAGSAPHVFVINSFSKYFSMTGWRLGWLVAPDAYLDALDRLAQNVFLAPSTLAQYAALHAFSPANLQQLNRQRDELDQRRAFLLKGLRELGFEIPTEPTGAFYIYANIQKFSSNSQQFCEQLLQQVHVAITPGIDFGEYQSEHYVRFAYTQPIEVLEQALQRISQFVDSSAG